MSITGEELSYNETRVLLTLNDIGEAASPDFILKKGKFEQMVEVMNAASWLQMKGLVSIHEELKTFYQLAKKVVADKDLPERAALKAIKKAKGSLKMDDLSKKASLSKPEVGIAIGWLKRKNWATLSRDGRDTFVTITEKGLKALHKKGSDENLIQEIFKTGSIEDKDADPRPLKMLLGRKDLLKARERVERTIEISVAGRALISQGLKLRKLVGPLTPDMIQNGEWGQVEFRRYDVNSFAPTIYGGKEHPLKQLLSRIRQIFLEMGFTEISGDYVQSAFWNMDALFIPQDHPARELQDTFYCQIPEKIDLSPWENEVDVIRQVHENGWETGSAGWGAQWDRAKAEKALLRTHTTVNTIRHLNQFNKPPVKVFSIERVFRNETIDKSHLPEFHQVEGILMEKGSNFRMLMGILKEFYNKMGFPEIRLRPAYYPYTEPSMDVEAKWQGKWLELGGSGIFRPEVVEPFGVEYPVLAWGLGLERLAMLLFGLDDIRDLYISDINWLKRMPLV